MDFGETQLIFETRGLPSPPFLGSKIGNILHFDEGTIVDKKWFPGDSKEPQPLPEIDDPRGPGGDNFGNFLAAVRSRRAEDLNAEVLDGHYSAALCHLANMSIRLGAKVPFNPVTDAFGNNEAAYDVLERTAEYLEGNGIDTETSGYTLGRKLMVDAKAEKIINDAEANMLLSRDYRKGFEVPERIA
jgi:hypothetical protein